MDAIVSEAAPFIAEAVNGGNRKLIRRLVFVSAKSLCLKICVSSCMDKKSTKIVCLRSLLLSLK